MTKGWIIDIQAEGDGIFPKSIFSFHTGAKKCISLINFFLNLQTTQNLTCIKKILIKLLYCYLVNRYS